MHQLKPTSALLVERNIRVCKGETKLWNMQETIRKTCHSILKDDTSQWIPGYDDSSLGKLCICHERTWQYELSWPKGPNQNNRKQNRILGFVQQWIGPATCKFWKAVEVYKVIYQYGKTPVFVILNYKYINKRTWKYHQVIFEVYIG
jgi:hypothetical protein